MIAESFSYKRVNFVTLSNKIKINSSTLLKSLFKIVFISINYLTNFFLIKLGNRSTNFSREKIITNNFVSLIYNLIWPHISYFKNFLTGILRF